MRSNKIMHTGARNNVCGTCSTRIPKNRRNLVCSLCGNFKHYKCQSLSKSDAEFLIANPQYLWTCMSCTVDILPVNVCSHVTRSKTTAAPQFKIKCGCCRGYSYSRVNIRTCPWCDSQVHAKCFNGSLGCNSCCADIIPGFFSHSYELVSATPTNNLLFNPYTRSYHTNQIGDRIANQEENDSLWNEISNLLTRCNYKLLNTIGHSDGNQLKVLSLNIRSLSKNIGLIREEITAYQKFDVICFNETNCTVERLPNKINDLIMEGFYEPMVKSPLRSSGKGGGLAVYINKRVCAHDSFENFELDLDPSNLNGEFQFIKIKQVKNSRNTVIIVNAYRSPSRHPESFSTLLDSVFHKLNRHSSKHILMVGDLNIDLIKHDSNINAQNLIDTASNYGFLQLISRPTRITEHSATLIDHVYSNKIADILCSDIATVDLSDHLATITTIQLSGATHRTNIPRNCDDQQRDYRIYNAATDLKFEQLITDETWDSVFVESNAQSQYDTFLETYTNHYNAAYPLRKQHKRRKKERLLPKPWILPWLEEACDRKNRLYHDFIISPSISNKVKYNKMKKFVDKHIKLSKSKYYKKYFNDNKDNSKKQWQMINELLGRNSIHTAITKIQDGSGNIANTPPDIAEQFNNYFANIATNLKSRITSRNSHHPSHYERFLTTPTTNSIYLNPVRSGEVYKIIGKLKNKSTLDSKISALKIANNAPKFTEALAKVVSSSFAQGIFPSALKRARVVPIYKGGSKSEVANYRPISLLSSFSKVYEKLMHARVSNFLDQNSSLHDEQFGFRAGRSCEQALLTAQSILLKSLNNKKSISVLLLIDFSKAFDMVDHSILLKKLHHYGIRGIALQWFKSYLGDRHQFVTINGQDSTSQHMQHGVPQGSILGPLLFIIYINDLPQISSAARFIMYADDANIIITGKNVAEISEQLNTLSRGLLDWVDCNGLALNLQKTNYMLFARKNTDLPHGLVIANTRIERKTEAKFLGVIVDEKLAWTKHIKTLNSKMSRYTGIMYKIKSSLPIETRLQIFHSFVQSHLNYCSLVWGFSARSNIESLFAKQKKGIRTVMPGHVTSFYKDGTLPSHTKPAFSNYNILTVHGIIIKNALMFMHKVKNLPTTLPLAVRATIAADAPTIGSDHVTCKEWLDNYGDSYHNKSLFFKGPLLTLDATIVALATPPTLFSILPYKSNVTRMLLDVQARGDSNEWEAGNFLLYNISGLRRSSRV